ncbi:MAG TPA: DUF3054 domain-containing protein [Anaerolineae bacterium]|nr:DUF3054 domain-containing protein [Anaerolineae bacterium]HNU04496.1 DUF3054 domain-containing protein [Anaerolineae bacterium]
MKRNHTLVLAAGDLLALLAFVLLGQADHQTLNAANPLLGALPNVAPLAVAWLLVAWLLRAYPRGSVAPRLAPFLGRTALAWGIAAPIGLTLRMLWLGRGSVPTAFLLVTLGFGWLFLLAWRLVFWLVAIRKRAV